MGYYLLLFHALCIHVQHSGADNYNRLGLLLTWLNCFVFSQMFEEFFTLMRSLKPLILLVLAPSQAERLADFREELEAEVYTPTLDTRSHVWCVECGSHRCGRVARRPLMIVMIRYIR